MIAGAELIIGLAPVTAGLLAAAAGTAVDISLARYQMHLRTVSLAALRWHRPALVAVTRQQVICCELTRLRKRLRRVRAVPRGRCHDHRLAEGPPHDVGHRRGRLIRPGGYHSPRPADNARRTGACKQQQPQRPAGWRPRWQTETKPLAARGQAAPPSAAGQGSHAQ